MWDPESGQFPIAPQNVTVTSAFLHGVLDLRWDNPATLNRNTAFSVLGVNIYRSETSDRGPFHRVNEFPVQSTFYRDQTDYALVSEVVPLTEFVYANDGNNAYRWRFKTKAPIVSKYDKTHRIEPHYASRAKDVTVYINGVDTPVHRVLGRTGEVTLVNQSFFDLATETQINPPDITESDEVVVEYYTPRNFVLSGLNRYVWYRLTTVVADATSPDGMSETPFSESAPTTSYEVEKLDYIWKEAVRRNAWILQQGGERVKFFLRKVCGQPCYCGVPAQIRENNKQPKNSCRICFGTGFAGGYDGPYDGIIVPDDAERRISQSARGRNVSHQYEVWCGPSPLLTQRDFIVKQTNERYSIGPVRRPTNRGNILQQHFTIGYLDESEIRYAVPVDGTEDLAFPQTRNAFIDMPRTPVDGGPSMEKQEGWQDPQGTYPEGPFETAPMITEKGNFPDNVEQRGRTRVWSNITQ